MRLAVAVAAALVSSLVAPAHAQTLPSDSAGCEGEISRWREFSAKENQGGHMDASVYEKIQSEIGQAGDLCQSGHDAQATKMIQYSMRQHGY